MGETDDSDQRDEDNRLDAKQLQVEPFWKVTVKLGLDYSNNRQPHTLVALRRWLHNLDRVRAEFGRDKLVGQIGAVVATERLLADLDPGDRNGRRAALTSLSAALGDLYNGREPPLYFRTRKKPDDTERTRRGIDGAETWITRANAAGFMNHLKAGGMGKWEAAEAVGKRVADAGIKCGKGTVAEWRRQLMEGDTTEANGSPPRFAIMRYRQLAAEDGPLGEPPRTEAERKVLLDLLAGQLGYRGFRGRK